MLRRVGLCILIVLVLVSIVGCTTNNSTHKNTIIVKFIDGTNATYIQYLEEKYNITSNYYRISPDGYVLECSFKVPIARADYILAQIRQESQVRRADFDGLD